MKVLNLNINAIYSAIINSSIINGYSEKKGISGNELKIFRSILRIVLVEENYRLPVNVDRILEYYSRFNYIFIDTSPISEKAYFEYLKIIPTIDARLIEKAKKIFDGYLLIKNKAKSLKNGNIVRSRDSYLQIYLEAEPLLRLLAYQAIEQYLSCDNCQKIDSCSRKKPHYDCALWKNDILVGKALSKTNLHNRDVIS